MRYIYLTLLSLLVITACSTPKKTECEGAESVAVTNQIPQFSADSAYAYVEAQCEFGSRVPGSEAHQRCLQYFVEFFQAAGADTLIVQEGSSAIYDGTQMPIRNVIAQFNKDASRRIMLCSHWDSRPYSDNDPDTAMHRTPLLGAADGASGVGVLMELARIVGENSPAIGVDIILFDLEDWGAPYWAENIQGDDWCLGSYYWARHPHTPGYKAQYAILLDMVGATDAMFYREYFSERYAAWVVDKVWNRASQLGLSQRFVNKNGGAVTDDHIPVNEINGTPCVNIIHHNPYSETGFGAFWHTQKDDMRNINKNTLGEVGRLLVDLIYKP